MGCGQYKPDYSLVVVVKCGLEWGREILFNSIPMSLCSRFKCDQWVFLLPVCEMWFPTCWWWWGQVFWYLCIHLPEDAVLPEGLILNLRMFAPWGKVVLDIYRNENTWESWDSVSEFREYAWIHQSLILSELYIMIFFF